MDDNVFKRTVCFVCAHNREEGSFGFILNKPTTYKLADFVDNLSAIDNTIYYGGPVGNDTLYFLHDNSLELEGALKITDNIYWGGDYEALQIKLATNKEAQKRIRFFLGYSGWGVDQLKKEIIENSWIISQSKPEYIYNEDKNLWKSIMNNMGELYQHLANLPERPELN
ncbi:MAG: YqgE/AlgH family protein [Chitinophagales bacterium]